MSPRSGSARVCGPVMMGGCGYMAPVAAP